MITPAVAHMVIRQGGRIIKLYFAKRLTLLEPGIVSISRDGDAVQLNRNRLFLAGMPYL